MRSSMEARVGKLQEHCVVVEILFCLCLSRRGLCAAENINAGSEATLSLAVRHLNVMLCAHPVKFIAGTPHIPSP